MGGWQSAFGRVEALCNCCRPTGTAWIAIPRFYLSDLALVYGSGSELFAVHAHGPDIPRCDSGHSRHWAGVTQRRERDNPTWAARGAPPGPCIRAWQRSARPTATAADPLSSETARVNRSRVASAAGKLGDTQRTRQPCPVSVVGCSLVSFMRWQN